VAFALACGPAIYGVDTNGKLYTFTPPSATATLVSSPGKGSGTISRGSFSGNVYLVAPTASNSALYVYNTSTGTTMQAATFPNTAFVYASGFNQAGVGYALSSTESFSFTDANPSTITSLAAPATTSGSALSAFNSGDLAFDQANNGWTILSNNSTGISYLYRVTFSTGSTSLSPVGQITLGGKPYTTADLYSIAFGADGTMYAAAGSSGTLYAINTVTGALTSDGSQGVALYDFASCPFVPQPSLVKNGPSQVAPGELVNYSIVASNAAGSHGCGLRIDLAGPAAHRHLDPHGDVLGDRRGDVRNPGRKRSNGDHDRQYDPGRRLCDAQNLRPRRRLERRDHHQHRTTDRREQRDAKREFERDGYRKFSDQDGRQHHAEHGPHAIERPGAAGQHPRVRAVLHEQYERGAQRLQA